MIHWSWLIFIIVVGGLSYKAYLSNKEPVSGYGFDLETPLYIILLIAFILIWGGVFWW